MCHEFFKMDTVAKQPGALPEECKPAEEYSQDVDITQLKVAIPNMVNLTFDPDTWDIAYYSNETDLGFHDRVGKSFPPPSPPPGFGSDCDDPLYADLFKK